MSIDPETNSTGFYRLMLEGGTSSNWSPNTLIKI
jgi:hypothetical protein